MTTTHGKCSKLLAILTLLLGSTILNYTPAHAGSFLNDACPGNVCNTAIGQISIASDFAAIKDILGLIVGIGGAIAFLLMIYGVYILTTSAGIPDKVNEGKEIISSAIFGLLFIILSLVVFRIIGINILAIPGIV